MCVNQNPTFKRSLRPDEFAEYSATLREAKAVTGQTGKSIFIMPSTCLPQSEALNTGVGNWASDKAQEYIDYMHKYLDFNIVEDLPSGQINPGKTGFYCSYNSSALALGINHINPELLTTDEFANLLTKDEFQEIVNSNNSATKNEIVNFKNVVNLEGSQNKTLKKAFDRFEKLDEKHELKQKFKKFSQENADWLNFPRAGEENQEFFKFKQFLADEHLKIGKEKLNKKGIKLYGDCQIGFSKDELKAFPKAFKENHYIGIPDWKLYSLDFDKVLDETSDASKLLKRKIQLFAKRYDSIRFDVAWAYVTPVMTPDGVHEVQECNKRYLNDNLLKKIENWVKEVKGNDFNPKDLIYEFEAGANDFTTFDNSGNLIEPLKGRTKIYSSTYMNHTGNDKWGYNAAYLERGWSPDEFLLGVGNHDPQPLKQIAKGIPEEIRVFDRNLNDYKIVYDDHKTPAIRPLAEELKISEQKLQDPVEFAKAKFAEPMMGKNNEFFYMDVFGREERFDMQGFNSIKHPEKNYGYKVPVDYENAYHKSLKEGFGFNIMDSFEKVFKAKGYDKSHPELYKRIEKYNSILSDMPQKSPVKKFNSKKAIIIGAISAIVLAIPVIISRGLNQGKQQNLQKLKTNA